MDQILNNGQQSMSQYALPENQSSMLSMEFYVQRVVTSILNQFIDGALFYDKGAYLYVWNNMMNLIKMYGIATVYGYTEERDRIEAWLPGKQQNFSGIRCMNNLIVHYDLCKSVFSVKRPSRSVASLSRRRTKDPNWNVGVFSLVHASDFIFRILYDKYQIFQAISAEQKHKLGLFLINALKVESEEKDRIKAFLENMKTETSHAYNPKECLKYDENFDDRFLNQIFKGISDGDELVNTLKDSTEEIREISEEKAYYSAWYIALAFVKYVETNKKTILKKDTAKQQLGFMNSILSSKDAMTELISVKKRTQEATYQMQVLQQFLPTVEEYEKEVAVPDRDRELLKILTNVPQVLASGRCLDKQELFDLTIEKNIRKIIETLKNQSQESLLDENTKRKLTNFLENPKESLDKVRSMVKHEVEIFFRNLIQGLKSQFYHEFFMPSQVIHGTFPLIGSLYFTQQMLSLAHRELSEEVQNMSKMAIYGLFPLVLSVMYETQESVLGAFHGKLLPVPTM